MRFSLDRVAGVWVAEQREKVGPAVQNKARRVHIPGHRLGMLDVWYCFPCFGRDSLQVTGFWMADWLGLGRTEFGLASSTCYMRNLTQVTYSKQALVSLFVKWGDNSRVISKVIVR